MKKTIILFAISLSLLSCSSDDRSPDSNLEVSYANLAGKWYYKEVIMGDGSIVPRVSSCPTTPDFIEFFSWGMVYAQNYYQDCTFMGGPNEEYYIFPGNRMETFGGDFPDCIVTKFTNEELHMQYEVDLAPGTETRTLILLRE